MSCNYTRHQCTAIEPHYLQITESRQQHVVNLSLSVDSLPAVVSPQMFPHAPQLFASPARN